MSRMRRLQLFYAVAVILSIAWPACQITVTDIGEQGAGETGETGEAGGDDTSGTGGDPGSDGGSSDPTVPESSVVADAFADENVRAAVRFAGDGMAAKQETIAAQYPELASLISGGTDAAEAMLAKFADPPSIQKDDHLFLFAVALQRMNYTAGVARLTDFLAANITSDLRHSLSAATHTVRSLIGAPLDETAYYLGSEIEETIALAGGSEPRQQAARQGPRDKCWREFVMVDPVTGEQLTYPPGHPKAGQPIVLGGNMHSENSLDPSIVAKLANEVLIGGGTPIDFSTGTATYQGNPSNEINCAGFVFHEVNDGRRWTSDPGRWYDALKAAGAIEQRIFLDVLESEPGDLAFYFNAPGSALPGHVARVHTNDQGPEGITVINADGPSGLFTAKLAAPYFIGDEAAGIFPRFRASRTEVWKFKGGVRPSFEVFTDRNPDDSCHGCDTNDDGFPDTDDCKDCPEGQCIDPELAPEDEEPPEPCTSCCPSDNACDIGASCFVDPDCDNCGGGNTCVTGCDEPDPDCDPDGAFNILSYVNFDGTEGTEAALAEIQLSGDPQFPTVSWSMPGIVAILATASTIDPPQTAFIYNVSGVIEEDADGNFELFAFATQSIQYGDYSRSDTSGFLEVDPLPGFPPLPEVAPPLAADGTFYAITIGLPTDATGNSPQALISFTLN